MKIQDIGISGTLESSDITIYLEPNEGKGIEIELKSTVENQFGSRIRNVIKATLEEMEITDVLVRANDKGALDCTIQARVITAVGRSCQSNCRPWEVK